jgi:cob(I)alamin adenosyltransferase
MGKVNALAREKDDELVDLYNELDEARAALDRAKELPGFQQLSKTHRDRDFSLVESEMNDFVSLVDDYIRGDEPK